MKEGDRLSLLYGGIAFERGYVAESHQHIHNRSKGSHFLIILRKKQKAWLTHSSRLASYLQSETFF